MAISPEHHVGLTVQAPAAAATKPKTAGSRPARNPLAEELSLAEIEEFIRAELGSHAGFEQDQWAAMRALCRDGLTSRRRG